MTDFRSNAEIRREKRNADICKMYLALRSEQPEVTRNRVLTVVAGRYGLTVPSIRNILVKAELYDRQSTGN